MSQVRQFAQAHLQDQIRTHELDGLLNIFLNRSFRCSIEKRRN
jgi:hypothetical protein